VYSIISSIILLEDWNEDLVTLNIFVLKVLDGSFHEAVNKLI
jgi:hypothetical protein